MNKDEKRLKIIELKKKAEKLKQEADYYNGLQCGLKLILNGSYGAFCSSYFVLHNLHVGGTITAMGRELTQTMDRVNKEYWYNNWHSDTDTHRKLSILNVTKIPDTNEVSIYADTDSLFVSFKPCMDSCEWKNILFSNLHKIIKPHIILCGENTKPFSNIHTITTDLNEFIELIKTNKSIIVDGKYIKNWDFWKIVKDNDLELKWNWSNELEFIHGVDHYKYADYFKEKLDEFGDRFGVDNKQDFELERISESIISLAKKKYIQNIVYEDGIPYDRLSYIFPKGVELVRSSTPLFARDKIPVILSYLFSNPETFNIRELLKLVKNLKREFDLCVPDRIDEICMQSSCSNYEEKVLDDKNKLSFVSGAHFAVKCSAYYNYLLHRNPSVQNKYEFIKSGSKIKYYYCNDKSVNDIFGFSRGSYPVEFGPDIDLDVQFEKAILSPINSIISPLGLPEINKRLSVVMDIFGKGF